MIKEPATTEASLAELEDGLRLLAQAFLRSRSRREAELFMQELRLLVQDEETVVPFRKHAEVGASVRRLWPLLLASMPPKGRR